MPPADYTSQQELPAFATLRHATVHIHTRLRNSPDEKTHTPEFRDMPLHVAKQGTINACP